MLPNISALWLELLGSHELCTSAKAGLSWSRSGSDFAVLDVTDEKSCRSRGDGGIRRRHAKV